MTRKGAVFAAGTTAIVLTIVSIAFQFMLGTALPGAAAPRSNGFSQTRLRVETARLAFQAPSGIAEPQPVKLFSPAVFSVGILREDAILIPFASFDGASWFNPWPEPRGVSIPSAPEAPERLSEIPPEWWGGNERALHWEALDSSGRRQIVTTTGAREFHTHCTTNVGLTTNFQSRVEGELLQRYVGAAATADNLLTPLARLDQSDEDLHAIARLLPQLFARLEPDVWKSAAGTQFEPLLRGPLRTPTLNHVYEQTLPDGSKLLAFDAHREVGRRRAGAQRLEMMTRVVGWFTSRGPAAPLVLLDGRGSQSLNGQGGDEEFVPFAALTTVGRRFWV